MSNVKIKGGSFLQDGFQIGLGGTGYVYVRGDGTPSENASDLHQAYARAKTMSPAVGNRLTVVVAPGTYTFGLSKFAVDTSYINIVSLTGNSDILIDGVNVTVGNVFLRGLSCGSDAFSVAASLHGLVCEACTGDATSFGFGVAGVTGSFINCTRGGVLFGVYSGSVVIDADGTPFIGGVGALQPVLTREDSPVNYSPLFYNTSTKRAETISGLAAKASLVNADAVLVKDSEDDSKPKWWTFESIKANLKGYFDPLYLRLADAAQTVQGAITFSRPPVIPDATVAQNPISLNQFDILAAELEQNVLDIVNNYEKQPISITYAALKALVDASELTVGQRYIINDYQTVHEIPNSGLLDDVNGGFLPNVINTAPVEPLLVTALSVNKLSNECYSLTFPEDIIYYDIESNQTMVPGCTKGYIYRRIDTKKGNDIGLDYRNVKFRRWQINVTNEHATGDASFNQGDVVKKTGTDEIYIKLTSTTGAFTDTSKWKSFEWNNLQYVSPILYNEGYGTYGWVFNPYSGYPTIIPTTTNFMDYHMFSTVPTTSGIQSSYDNIYGNKINVNASSIIASCNSVLFGTSFYSNSIGNGFIGNTIGASFYGNTVGNSFQYNTIGASFYGNTIGDYFNGNTIGNGFNSNVIGIYFQYNTIGDGFQYNTIGDYFQYNTIGDGFQYNTIGDYFNGNSIGDSFYGNSIGDYFNVNTIGNNFQYNTIGSSFNSNTIGDGFSSNTIGININGNTIGDGFYGNSIGGDFNGNTIGNNFQFNTIGNGFNSTDYTSSTYVYHTYPKELFTNSAAGQFLKFYDGSNVLQIVSITA